MRLAGQIFQKLLGIGQRELSEPITFPSLASGRNTSRFFHGDRLQGEKPRLERAPQRRGFIFSRPARGAGIVGRFWLAR